MVIIVPSHDESQSCSRTIFPIYLGRLQAAPATNESLTAAALAAAPPEKQKNMIGERLYPLIHEGQPQLAGKITGAFHS